MIQTASIGVIGGADGPTAIYVASDGSAAVEIAVAVICVIIAFVTIAVIRKKNNK